MGRMFLGQTQPTSEARVKRLVFHYSIIVFLVVLFISGCSCSGNNILHLHPPGRGRALVTGELSVHYPGLSYAPYHHQSAITLINRPEAEASNHNYNNDIQDYSSAGASSSSSSGVTYSGPRFVLEPGPADQVLVYSNHTKVSVQCRASGYPVPSIVWRVDNLTLRAPDHSEQRHFYSDQLNTHVMFRHDGQTLVIGGDGTSDQSSGTNHLGDSSHLSFFSHRIECLASNQFGVIVSPPVSVQHQPHSPLDDRVYGTALNEDQAAVWNNSLASFDGPQQHSSSSVSSFTVQLYDEFVARGNVVVLKCLVLPSFQQDAKRFPLDTRAHGTYRSHSHHHQTAGDLADQYVFEWRIKTGPASPPNTANHETILSLRSNSTQGKYTAYPSGELHVRDVDEHDAHRTYQCVVSPRYVHHSSRPTSWARSISGSMSPSSSFSSSSSHYELYPSASSSSASGANKQTEKVESSFAQIILTGNDKDVFMPRIVHRVAEMYASEHQLEPILIPCAGQAQPAATYHWFWVPFAIIPDGEQLDLSWENELASLVSSLPSSSAPNTPTANSVLVKLAIPIKPSGGDDLKLNLGSPSGRLKNLGSTLVIQGPIGQADSGYYIGIVSNTIGYDRCLTAVYVRSPIQVRLEAIKQQTELQDYRSTANQTIVTVTRGQVTRLRCSVSGLPISSIYWLHNTIPLATTDKSAPGSSSSYRNYNQPQQQSSSSSSDRFSAGTLHPAVRDVQLKLDDHSQSGMYQCMARNRFQTAQASIELMVRDQSPVILDHFSEQISRPGEYVSLRCTALGSPLAQIEWSVDRLPISNSARFHIGDYVTEWKDSNNIEEQQKMLVSHLNISAVRVEDGGLYRCTANNIAGQTYHEARVNVYGKAMIKLHTPNITTVAGMDVQLDCPYYGYPVKHINWFAKDGAQRKLPVNGRQQISANGTLILSKVNKKEDEGFYECEMQQDNGLTSRARIYLTVITGPRIDNFTFASNLEEGMRSVAVCAVIAGDPPIRIRWYKDGVQLMPSGATPQMKIEMVNEFTSSLTFTALKRGHVGRYTCTATNTASSDQHSAELKVNVAPIWLYEPKDVVSIGGKQLMINCQAEGIPEPQIRWKMETTPTSSKSEVMQPNTNGFHAVISNAHMQILENGTLLIKQVARDDHRRYMCSAFNGVGSGISTIIHLAVHFPPQLVYGHLESKSSKSGETVVLTCLVSVEHIDAHDTNRTMKSLSAGLDNIIQLRWYKHNMGTRMLNLIDTSNGEAGPEYIQARYHIMPTFQLSDPSNLTTTSSDSAPSGGGSPIQSNSMFYASKLTIRSLERIDSGHYVCSAHNRYGVVKKDYLLRVLEPPDKPAEVRSEVVTSSTIRLRWQSAYDGNSPISEYIISYRAMSPSSVPVTISVSAHYAEIESTSLGTSSKSVSYQLSDLVPFTLYSIQIKAKNAVGFSAFTDAINVKTAEEPPSDVPNDVSILPLSTRSLKISWRRPRYAVKKAKQASYVPPVTGYYIGYRPNRDHSSLDGDTEPVLSGTLSNEFIFKTIKASNPGESDGQSESFVLNNLKRATRYDVKIQAFNLAGAGPSTSEFSAKTLDFDVPGAPKIRALKSNLSTILLSWTVQGEEPVSGYIISYKMAASGTPNAQPVLLSPGDTDNDWKTIKVDNSESDNSTFENSWAENTTPASARATKKTYLLDALKCGTKYFIYVNAYNSVGQGDPSEVILARTDGNVPIAPENVSSFLLANNTFVQLKLSKWKPMGCAIESFELEYRQYGDNLPGQKLTYRMPSGELGNRSSSLSLTYDIYNLNPGTWYELIVRSYTESGYTSREYIFSTLRPDGSTIAPLTLKAIEEWNSRQKGANHHLDASHGPLSTLRSSIFVQLHFVIPVICALFILFLVVVVICIIQTNQRNQFLLHLVSGRHNRHKVASGGKAGSTTSGLYSTVGGGTLTEMGSTVGGSTMMMMMHDNDTNASNADNSNSSAEFCNKEHIFTAIGKLCTGSGLNGEELGTCRNEMIYGKRGGPSHRTDSCHSITCDHVALETTALDKMTMLKSFEANVQQQQQAQNVKYQQYMVPYATSSLANSKSMDQEPIYASKTYQAQLAEMYCENGIGGTQQQQAIMLNNVQARVSLQGNARHQYELPFVFTSNNNNKPGPGPSSAVKHNDSTAF